jgi:spermidine dehydrogenase
VLSAYADYAADVLLPWKYDAGAQMFPGGNTGIARHILKKAVPGALPGPATLRGLAHARVNFRELDNHGKAVRVRLQSTVLKVRHEGEPGKADTISVVYVKAGKLYRVTASSAIIAGGSWTARHIVEALPETHAKAYAQFFRSPCLMANVAVRNWRFLSRLGLTEAQWYEGLGSYTAVRRVATFGSQSAALNPDMPTVLNFKVLFPYPGSSLEEQSARGRIELLTTSYSDYERQIREQLTHMFARSGFNAKRDIAGIILNRWGHAYLSPQPGFFFGKNGEPAPGELLREKPFGRIAFANSDLTGIMDHRTSILEAQRAAKQVSALLS